MGRGGAQGLSQKPAAPWPGRRPEGNHPLLGGGFRKTMAQRRDAFGEEEGQSAPRAGGLMGFLEGDTLEAVNARLAVAHRRGHWPSGGGQNKIEQWQEAKAAF
jgi:hypothetical protein